MWHLRVITFFVHDVVSLEQAGVSEVGRVGGRIPTIDQWRVHTASALQLDLQACWLRVLGVNAADAYAYAASLMGGGFSNLKVRHRVLAAGVDAATICRLRTKCHRMLDLRSSGILPPRHPSV